MNQIYTIACDINLIGEENLLDISNKLKNLIEVNKAHIKSTSENDQKTSILNKIDQEVDIVITPLNTVPTPLNEEWAIAALVSFEHYKQGLFIHPEWLDTSADLRLKSGATIGVYEEIDGMQLKELNHTIDYLKVEGSKEAADLLKNDKIGAFFANNKVAEKNIAQLGQNITFININPKEIVPAAGSKALAILCRKENITLRKAIQNIHDKEVSKLSNVERKTAQLLAPNQVRSYCDEDSRGNFHLYLASTGVDGQFKSTKVSQNTTTQLIDNTIIALNQA